MLSWNSNVMQPVSVCRTRRMRLVFASRHVARIWKRGGGLFWKSEKCANDLDWNFHWSRSSFRRIVRKLSRNFSESSEIQRFFPPKLRWSPKKKKKVFTKIESDFSAEIRNSKVVSAHKKVISKKEKKKKGLHQNWEGFFGRNPKFFPFFSAQNQVISTKKKKKVFTDIETDFSSNFANSVVWGGTVFEWGGYFLFFSENWPQKHKKHAILHTSQANGGARAPPRPPWLRYCLLPSWIWKPINFYLYVVKSDIWWSDQHLSISFQLPELSEFATPIFCTFP